ncbi:MAG: response regulator transcription factor [Chloroflexota bacterium]
MIRVLICDDQAIARQGLQLILSTVPDIDVVGTAEDGQQAVEFIAKAEPNVRPEVVLMDLKMPNMNGVQATRSIREQFEEVRVLVLTTYDADEWLFDAVRSGAHGYLLKDSPPEQLLQAIRGTADGRSHIDPNIAGKVLTELAQRTPINPETLPYDLREREVEVLRFIAKGYTNAEIAAQVHLSEGTVSNYISAILSKLDASDRTQAAVTAIRYGLIDLSEI